MKALFLRFFLFLLVLFGVAVPAVAQPFTCNATAPVAPSVRAEGVAELVSDIVLQCTGGTAGVSLPVNFAVFLNTNVTSRIVSGPATTEALLLIDDVYTSQGTLAGVNNVAFLGVSVVEPGAGVRTLRFVNIRANASTVMGPQILANISASSYVSIPINNASLVVASPQAGASVALRTPADAAYTAASLAASTPINQALLGSAGPTPTATFNVKFTEGFASAFRKRNPATTASDLTTVATTGPPGTVQSTETGLYLGTPALAGVPTQGTRLMARFTAVPAGARLFATLNPVSPGTTAGVNAVMVVADGNGANTPPTGTPALAAGLGGFGYPAIAEIPVIGGVPTVVWEITGSSIYSFESVSFGIYLAYSSSPEPLPGTAQVTMGLAPLSTVGTASATEAEPRFADVATAQTAFSIGGKSSTGCLVVTPSAANFTWTIGAPPPASLGLFVTSTGTAAVPFTASASPGWVQLPLGPTYATPSGVLIRVDTAAFFFTGTYYGSVKFMPLTSGCPEVAVPVAVNVPSFLLVLDHETLELSSVAGGTPPAAASLRISGPPGVAFTATPANPALLTVTPPAGVLPATVGVSMAANLSPGTYNTSIVITAVGASDSPRTVPVTIRVTAMPLAVSPSSLQFRWVKGSPCPAQTVSVTSGTAPTSFTVAPSAAWVRVTPASGTTPASLSVSIDCSNLQAGTFTGSLAVAAQGGSTQTVAVAATVVQPNLTLTPTALSFVAAEGRPAPAAQTLTVRGADPDTGADVPLAFTFTFAPTGSWLSVSASGATLSVSVNHASLAASLTPYAGSIGVTAPDVSGGVRTVNVSLLVNASPAISSGPFSAASLAAAVSPGSIVTIFGRSLGPAEGAQFRMPGGVIETTLAGTRVLALGVAIPLLFVNDRQINAIMPYAAAGQSSVPVVVERLGVRSDAVTVNLSETAPALFTVNGSGTGAAAALNQDGSVNLQSNPAGKGTYAVFYGTGGGQTSPASPDGRLNPPIAAQLVLPASVTVDGIDAEIAYAGAAPNLVSGAMQLNVRIPQGARSGAVPVVVTIGFRSSPAGVTVFVQ